MKKKYKYLYGPVLSRRLGKSLGVDFVPFKICTLDCIYCQLGQTTRKTTERKPYIPAGLVLAELKDIIAQGIEADYVTIGGSGEPTLNCQLGELIDGIKNLTDIPVAILTNGTLLFKADVRAECSKADLVLPSLDAADQQSFEKVNRPHKNITFQKLVEGLCAFRDEFAAAIWLEVFLIDGFNTEKGHIEKIKGAIELIRPDKVQLNTAVRPTAEPGVKGLSLEKLKSIAEQLSGDCEIISSPAAGPPASHQMNSSRDTTDRLLSILKRRPCTLTDLSSALEMTPNELLKYISSLQQQGLVESLRADGRLFFRSD